MIGKETLSVVGPLPRDFDSAAVMQEFRTSLRLPGSGSVKGANGDVPQVCKFLFSRLYFLALLILNPSSGLVSSAFSSSTSLSISLLISD